MDEGRRTDGRQSDWHTISSPMSLSSGELNIDNYSVYRRLGNKLVYSFLTWIGFNRYIAKQDCKDPDYHALHCLQGSKQSSGTDIGYTLKFVICNLGTYGICMF